MIATARKPEVINAKGEGMRLSDFLCFFTCQDHAWAGFSFSDSGCVWSTAI